MMKLDFSQTDVATFFDAYAKTPTHANLRRLRLELLLWGQREKRPGVAAATMRDLPVAGVLS